MQDFSSKQAEKGINHFKSKAIQYIKDRNKAAELLRQATKKTGTENGRITNFKNQLFLVIDLYHDWHNGNYRQISTKTLTMIVIAILYFVVPTDMIPDFLLGAGLIDDAAVIAYIFKQINKELDQYEDWKEKQPLTNSLDRNE